MSAPMITGANVQVPFGTAKNISAVAPTRAAGNGLLFSLWLENPALVPSTPAGWTLMASVARGALFKEWIYGRIADNTTTDNFSSEWAESKARFGEMRRITGNNSNLATWLIGASANGSGAKATITGITTTSAENLLIAFQDTATESTVKSVTGGWVADGSPWTPVVAKTQGAAGASGALEVTYAESEEWVGVMVAIPPPEPPAPSVTTEAASAIAKTEAIVNGTVNPNGAATTYWFEYGTTEALGSKTTTGSAGEGSSGVAKSKNLSGLTGATKYFFRLVAESVNGKNTGGILSFTTEALVEAPMAVPRPIKPPLDLIVEIETHDGELFLLDPSSRSASRRPQAINFATERGEGFGPGSFSVARSVMKDYEDLNLLNKVRFIGVNGDVAYAGRIHDFVRTNDPMEQFTITTVGPMALAKMRRFSELYTDHSFDSWSQMSTTRRAGLYAAGWNADAAPMNVGPDDKGLPSMTAIAQGPINKPWYEFTYDGLGADVALLTFGLTRINLNSNAGDAHVHLYCFGADDLAHSNEVVGTDISAGPTGEFAPTNPKGVVGITGSYDTAGGVAGLQFGFRIERPLAVGAHGLPLVGAAPEQGIVASDILAHIFNNFTPLTWAGNATSYPVKQARYRGQFPLDAAKALNDFHLWELNVFEEERVQYYPADLTVADWQVRTDDPGVRFNQGDSIDGYANGVECTFTDFTGRQLTIYPSENAELRDESETNPANQHGIPLWVPFTVPFPTIEADALQMSRAYLFEYNRPKAPGTITISGGHIRDGEGHWQEAWKPRCGQTLALTNHPNDAPRLITSTPSWNQDAKTLTISVDNGYQLLQAFLARWANAREAANQK